MPDAGLKERFERFVEGKVFGKGALSIALIVTQHARELGLPIDPNDLLVEKGGQVKGAGGAQIAAILRRHNIDRVLAAEGGRTNRGSIDVMRQYVDFLNDEAKRGAVDIEAIEGIWIDKVKEFFASKPFKLHIDVSKSFTATILDLIDQAYDAQEGVPGLQYAGAILQHLIGAALETVLGDIVDRHSFSTSDAATNRAGDFVLGDVAIHVTTAPSEAVIKRCAENLAQGKRPILITLPEKPLTAAIALAEVAAIADRVEIYDVGQYLSSLVLQRGAFANATTQQALIQLMTRYNDIVEHAESDPALKVEW